MDSGEAMIVISTVGDMHLSDDTSASMIGCGRYYETLAFHACRVGDYWEADVSRQIHTEGQWKITGEVTARSDAEANAMHDAMVERISVRLASGESYR